MTHIVIHDGNPIVVLGDSLADYIDDPEGEA